MSNTNITNKQMETLTVTGTFEQRFATMITNLHLKKESLKIKEVGIQSNTSATLIFESGTYIGFDLNLEDEGIQINYSTMTGKEMDKEQAKDVKFIYNVMLGALPNLRETILGSIVGISKKYGI